jgi:hypothetical protein
MFDAVCVGKPVQLSFHYFSIPEEDAFQVFFYIQSSQAEKSFRDFGESISYLIKHG